MSCPFSKYVVEDIGDLSLTITFYKRHNKPAYGQWLFDDCWCVRETSTGKLLPIPTQYKNIQEGLAFTS